VSRRASPPRTQKVSFSNKNLVTLTKMTSPFHFETAHASLSTRLRLMARRIRSIAGTNATFQFPLMDLPHELIASVIECATDPKSLASLSTSCRLLHSLAEPLIYHRFLLRSGKEMTKLERILWSRKERMAMIRDFDFACDGFVSSLAHR
jgi:hypothetical protein